jgi:hypothetical protein
MRRKWIVLGPLALLGIAVVIVIGGGSVMLLWNWLLPMLFGWPQVTFWQALGLLALCRMLFGHWGGRGSHRSRLRQRLGERWERMTPEERERLRARCGGFGAPPSSSGTKEPA